MFAAEAKELFLTVVSFVPPPLFTETEIKAFRTKILQAKFFPDWRIISPKSWISEDRTYSANYLLSLVAQVLSLK